jgi:serine/threonine-protein kinase
MPEKIGQYTIVSQLGRGGMGIVYKALDASLNRHVAIKVLTERLTDDQLFLQRFVREAQAAAGVSHPNIVSIYYIGEDNGNPYFVMEYVTGKSLSTMLAEEKRIANPRAAQLILQAAHGLAAAHDKGIIHRDIKPGNLMLDERGMVKIADFGLALPVAADTKLTATGMLVGTPGYLAPEQCRGEVVDHRTDIYALGITFYELLSGTTPFHAESPFALMKQILDEEAPDIAAIHPDVDPETRRIIAKMIAKDRAQRYQSCHEIVTDLEECLAKRGVRSMTAGLATRSSAAVVAAAAAASTPTQIVSPTMPVAAPPAAVTMPNAPMLKPDTLVTPQPVAFVPPPAKRSSALLPLLIIAILLGGGFVAIYAGMKVFHGWQASRDQHAAATTTAPAKPQANTTSAAALTPPLNPDVLLTQPQTPAATLDTSAPAAAAPQAVVPSVVSTPAKSARAAASTSMPTRVATAAPLREPAPSQPQAAPRRALKGVAVAVTGDQALNGPIASVLTSELSAAGLDATDAQTLPATEELMRAGGASASRLIERLREEGFASLLLARVEPAGERELSYMGRHDTAYSSRVTLVSYDLASGHPYGSTSSATIEYTSRTAERESEKVIGPVARAKAESMQRNSH